MDIKPGYKTSEFYIALVGPAISLLIAFGVISPDQGEEIESAAVQLIMAIFAVIVAVAPVVTYIWSRAKVKSAAIK